MVTPELAPHNHPQLPPVELDNLMAAQDLNLRPRQLDFLRRYIASGNIKASYAGAYPTARWPDRAGSRLLQTESVKRALAMLSGRQPPPDDKPQVMQEDLREGNIPLSVPNAPAIPEPQLPQVEIDRIQREQATQAPEPEPEPEPVEVEPMPDRAALDRLGIPEPEVLAERFPDPPPAPHIEVSRQSLLADAKRLYESALEKGQLPAAAKGIELQARLGGFFQPDGPVGDGPSWAATLQAASRDLAKRELAQEAARLNRQNESIPGEAEPLPGPLPKR